MANGPLGGFMPTPAAPSQPPQVKVGSTADSRGNFNNFLKSMNGASVNPPLAPSMGAVTPVMAPNMPLIDIFDQPAVQMMQRGGEAEDFSDFAGFDDPSDPFGDGGDSLQGDDDSQIIGTPVDISQEVAALPDVLTETDPGLFADDPSSATPMGLQAPVAQNFGATTPTLTFNDLNQSQINEIRREINNRNEVSLTEEDRFFKDGDLTPAGKVELDKRNKEEFQLVSAGQIPPSEYISAGTATDILGDKNILDLGMPGLDVVKPGTSITTTPGGTIITEGPGFRSTEKITRSSDQDIGDNVANLARNQLARNQVRNLNPNITSDVGQLSTLDPMQSNLGIAPIGEQRRGSRGDMITASTPSIPVVPQDMRDIIAQDENLARIEREQQAIRDQRARVNLDRDQVMANLASVRPDIDLAEGRGLRVGTIPEIANVPEIDSSGIPFVDPNEFDDGAMRDQTLSAVTRNINEAARRDNQFVGPPLPPEDPFDPDVGRRVFATTPLTLRRGKDNEIEGVSLRDIEGLYSLPEGQAKGAPPTRLGLGDIVLGPIEELGGKIAGGIGLPEGLSKIVSPLTTFGKGILNLPGGITRAKIADAITDGKFTDIFGREFPVRSDQIIRNDRTGDITGIRNPSDGPLAGKVAIGFDPDDIDLYQGDDDQASTPLIRRVRTEEAPKAATGPSVPNVFGSGQPAVTQTVEETPTVVASPFAPASSAIRPITFDTGQLNELIKLLTGVPARPIVSAANGGLIRAVDDFLATG
jgi:hypothetical protein